MGRPDTSDWININNIVYIIYTIKNTEEMQRKFLERLRAVIYYDAAVFCLAAKDRSDSVGDAVSVDIDKIKAYSGEQHDFEKDIIYSERSLIYRDSRSYSVIQMILGTKGRFLGSVILYRNMDKEGFDYNDVFTLDVLKDHMSFSLDQRTVETVDIENVINISDIIVRYSLTKREEEVLRHMMARKDNYTISDELSISMNTLKKHERNIYQKCGVGSRMQLFKLVMNEAG